MVDLNAMSVFVTVVEAGSYVAAARVAGIPKSTIARRIEELEANLGVRLLQRSTRKSELTDAGREFYERCRQIVENVQDAVASVTEHQSEPKGKLRFTTSPLLAEMYVGRWTAEYMERYPEVQIDMFLSTRHVDLIADGFDLAVRASALAPSSHIVRRLAPAPSFICASPGYLEARGTPRSTEELKEHACVLFSPERVHPSWQLSNERGDHVSVSVTGPVLVNSPRVAQELCLAGRGLAELPAILCCDAVRSGDLVRVLPEWANESRTLHALYPSRRHLSPVVRTFLDFMADKLSPAPWLGN